MSNLSYFNVDCIYPIESYDHSDPDAVGIVTFYEVTLSRPVGKFPAGSKFSSVTINPELGIITLYQGDIKNFTYRLQPMDVRIPTLFYCTKEHDIGACSDSTYEIDSTTISIHSVLEDKTLFKLGNISLRYTDTHPVKEVVEYLSEYYNAPIVEDKVLFI